MKSKALPPVALAAGTIFLAAQAQAAPLAPNDPSLRASPDIWLTDAGNRFDGTTWLDASGNGHDATAVGFKAAGTPAFPEATYLAGTSSTQFSTSGVAFSAAADDLMEAGATYAGLTDVTIITVYSTTVGAGGNVVRPVGLGSQAAQHAVTATLLNLSTDGSLRYDNGNNLGPANPTNTLLVRASRLDSGAVKNWTDSGSGPNVTIDTSTPTGGTIPNPLSSDADALYFGDVRNGATDLNNPPSPTTADLFISQIAVYRGALTNQEISDVMSWMVANPDGISGAPVDDLRLVDYQLSPAGGSLTWTSSVGKIYKITGSLDLLSFPHESATGIASGGATTSHAFTAPAAMSGAAKAFYRVEEE